MSGTGLFAIGRVGIGRVGTIDSSNCDFALPGGSA